MGTIRTEFMSGFSGIPGTMIEALQMVSPYAQRVSLRETAASEKQLSQQANLCCNGLVHGFDDLTSVSFKPSSE